MHVLVVDDDWRVLEAIGMMFQHHPKVSSVSTAHNYETAVERMEQSSPDIACIDIHLGTYSGFDVCRTIRRAYPRTFIAVITGDASTDNRRIASSLGTHAFLKKPMALDDVQRVVSGYLVWIESLR